MSVAEHIPVLPDSVDEVKKVATEYYQKYREWKTAHDKKQKDYDETLRNYTALEQNHRKTLKEYDQNVRAYNELEEKFRILSHAFYGRSSEKWTADEKLQTRLFDEAELAVSEAPEEPEIKTVESYQRKSRGKRKPISESIPREEIIHDIPDEEKTCGCGEPLVRIGEETSEKLELIPARIKAIRHIRPKYACKACEGSGDEEAPAVRIAAAPKELLPKSIASAGLISHIITSKYCDALPLYRQEKMFSRIGVEIKRASMARWIIDLGSRISPVLSLMDERIRGGPVIQMDETRIQVHNEPGREDHTQSYMWVVRGGPPETPLIRYMYHPTRSGKVALTYLKDFSGYLHTDGYDGYRQIGEKTGIIHVACLAHARRKFDDATKVSGGSAAAMEFISIIQKIYRVEKQLRERDLNDDEFVRIRKEQVLPFFEKLETRLSKKSTQVAPSSALGRAVEYLKDVLPRIKRYLDSPHLTPDTNAVERAIRPFTIGRNYVLNQLMCYAHLIDNNNHSIPILKENGYERFTTSGFQRFFEIRQLCRGNYSTVRCCSEEAA